MQVKDKRITAQVLKHVYDKLKQNSDALSDRIDDLNNCFETVYPINILDPDARTAGWVEKNGTAAGSTSTTMSWQAFDADAGDVLRAYKWTGASYAAHAMRYICAYVGGVAEASLGVQNVSSYTVPEGVTKVIISLVNTATLITRNTETAPTEQTDYFEPYLAVAGMDEKVSQTQLSEALVTKQDVISDLSTIRSGAAAGADALTKNPDNWPTMTIAQQDTACAVVGAERAKGDWVLKGTMDGSVKTISVDLTGCTELFVKTRVVTTANLNFYCNFGSGNTSLINGIGTNAGYRETITTINCNGMMMYPVDARCKVEESSELYVSNLSVIAYYNRSVSDIVSFSLSSISNHTECNIQIYSR